MTCSSGSCTFSPPSRAHPVHRSADAPHPTPPPLLTLQSVERHNRTRCLCFLEGLGGWRAELDRWGDPYIRLSASKIGRRGQIILARCSLTTYIADRDAIGFRECHKSLMGQTPFAPFSGNRCPITFSTALLEDIADAYARGREFTFGETIVSFTPEDVSLILGVPCTRLPVHHYGSNEEPSRLRQRFGEALFCKRGVIQELIQQLVGSDDPVDIADTVRLWILLLFCTFLCPQTGYTCPRQLLHYLDHLESLWGYAWAVAFHELIMHKFNVVVNAVRDKRGGRRTLGKRKRGEGETIGNIFFYGCSAALAVWFFEHTRVRQPLSRSTFPRLFRWESLNSRKLKWMAASLTAQQVVANIEVVAAERSLLGVEDACEGVEPATSGVVHNVTRQVMALIEVVKSMEERHTRQLNEFKEEMFAKVDHLEKKIDNLLSNVKPSTSRVEKQQMDEKVAITDEVEEMAHELPVEMTTQVPEVDKWEEMTLKNFRKKRCPRPKKPSTNDSHTFCGKGLMGAENEAIIQTFLSADMSGEHVVVNSTLGAEITRRQIQDLLFRHMTDDDVLDFAVDLLKQRQLQSPDQYHRWGYLSTVLRNNVEKIFRATASRARGLLSLFSDFSTEEAVGRVDFIFLVLHSSNHWHLLALDMQKGCFTSYNSIKGDAKHDGRARTWMLILKEYFEIVGVKKEIKNWELHFDQTCPSQPLASLDCALYVVKFLEMLTVRENTAHIDFTSNDLALLRGELAVEMVKKGSQTTA